MASIESKGESVVQQPTDFIGSADNVLLGEADETESCLVKISTRFTITQDDQVGLEIMRFDLDRNLTEKVAEHSKHFEQFSISNLQVEIASTSPMGTSSGAGAIAHIPDPANSVLSETDLEDNLIKLVRQSGSILIRPRESATLHCNTSETVFCTPSNDVRYSSLGSIVGVVRDTPSTGDEINYTCTLSCSFTFIRPTFNNNVEIFSDNIVLTLRHIGKQFFTFAIPESLLGDRMTGVPFKRIVIKCNKYLFKGQIMTHIFYPKKFKIHATHDPKLVKIYFTDLIKGDYRDFQLVTGVKIPIKITSAIKRDGD